MNSLWLMTVGCGAVTQLGVQPPSMDAAATFNGITAIKISGEGQFIVQWEPPTDIGASRSSSYEVYLDSWTTLPAQLQAAGALSTVSGDGVPEGVQLGRLPDVDSPVGKGSLLGTSKGGRNYTLATKLEPRSGNSAGLKKRGI